MVQAIGTWVYVISAALIVVAFVELLLPRSATTGLVRVVAGLCVIALILEAVVGLFSAGFSVDLDFDAKSSSGFAQVRHTRDDGEALAAGTLATIGAAPGTLGTPMPTAATVNRGQAEAGLVSAGVGAITVQAVPLVKVGVRLD